MKNKQNLKSISISTGGFVAAHSRGDGSNVRIPHKATGNLPQEEPKKLTGLAKASPAFKAIKAESPKSKEDEKKAIAEAMEKDKLGDEIN